MLRHIRLQESEKQHKSRAIRELVDAKTRHANWAARKYAATLMLQDGVNLVSRAGGELTIRKFMGPYAVHPALKDYASREVVRILTEKGRA